MRRTQKQDSEPQDSKSSYSTISTVESKETTPVGLSFKGVYEKGSQDITTWYPKCFLSSIQRESKTKPSLTLVISVFIRADGIGSVRQSFSNNELVTIRASQSFRNLLVKHLDFAA